MAPVISPSLARFHGHPSRIPLAWFETLASAASNALSLGPGYRSGISLARTVLSSMPLSFINLKPPLLSLVLQSLPAGSILPA